MEPRSRARCERRLLRCSRAFRMRCIVIPSGLQSKPCAFAARWSIDFGRTYKLCRFVHARLDSHVLARREKRPAELDRAAMRSGGGAPECAGLGRDGWGLRNAPTRPFSDGKNSLGGRALVPEGAVPRTGRYNAILIHGARRAVRFTVVWRGLQRSFRCVRANRGTQRLGQGRPRASSIAQLRHLLGDRPSDRPRFPARGPRDPACRWHRDTGC